MSAYCSCTSVGMLYVCMDAYLHWNISTDKPVFRFRFCFYSVFVTAKLLICFIPADYYIVIHHQHVISCSGFPNDSFALLVIFSYQCSWPEP